MARWLQETRASPKSGEIRSLLTPSEGWLTVLLLFGVQITPVVAVHTSNWADPSPRLWLIAIAGFVIGLSAAKAGGRGAYLAAALLGAALGAGLALWETAGTLSGPLGGRFGEVFDRVDAWIGAIGDAGGISNDRLPFGFGLAVLSFAMPFLSTLLYFRYHWGWPAVIIPALVLLTNQTYLPNSHYVVPTFFFLLLSILFLGRIYYLSRLEHWRQQGTKRVAGRYSFVMNVAALTAVVFAAGWSIPNTDVVIPKLRDAYQDARGPWRGLEDEFERVFAGIPSKRGSPLHSFGGALPLRGGINPGYGPVFSVVTDVPAYWRGQSYDFYQGRGWIALEELRAEKDLRDVDLVPRSDAYRKQEIVAQRFVLHEETAVLFAAGRPVEFSVNAKVEIASPRVYEIDLRGGESSPDLPADIAAVVGEVSAVRGGRAETQALLPEGTRMIGESGGTIEVSRDPPGVPDVLAAEARGRLKVGDSYEALSVISIATPEDLRGAGAAYPKWVTDNYLQLPEDLPPRVIDLANTLTAGIENPFDKGLAIAAHLRSYQQTYAIPSPPLNVDAIDHFLFTQQAGYSDYFASAMAVLLRASDVPARLASGYATGDFNQESSSYTVTFADAHSWPEVFFPDFGWIPFEPSPSLEPIVHGPPPPPDLRFDSSGVDIYDPFDEFLDLFSDPELFNTGLDAIRPPEDTSVTGVFRSVFIRVGLAIAALTGLIATLLLLVFLTWEANFLGLPYAHGVYARMARLGAYAGIRPTREQTPVEYAARLADRMALDPEDATAVAHGFAKVRYGARELSDEERIQLQERWSSLRGALIGALVRRIDPRRWGRS